MALRKTPAETLIPLRRVLPVVGRNFTLSANRMVRGRLRFRMHPGMRIFVPHEDYLSLCEATWNAHVCRMTGRTPPVEPPNRGGREVESVKPIHDGRLLDRHRTNPLLRATHRLLRWWRG